MHNGYEVSSFWDKTIGNGVIFLFFRPQQAYRVFNTWMGDPGKLLMLEKILEVMKRDNLISLVEKTGKKLKSELLKLEGEFPHILNSTRGRGTFLAVNCAKTALRDNIIFSMKQKGIYIFFIYLFDVINNY